LRDKEDKKQRAEAGEEGRDRGTRDPQTRRVPAREPELGKTRVLDAR